VALALILVSQSAARRGFAGFVGLQAIRGAVYGVAKAQRRGFAGFVGLQAMRGAVYGVKMA
jgi:hypothetical protein